jgi:hypothetical protein
MFSFNSKLFFILALVSVALFLGTSCGQKEPSEKKTTMEVMLKPYSPPADGKVTAAQAEAFAGAFLGLLQLDVRYSRKWGDLLSTDSLYLATSDSSFVKEHPELTERVEQLLEAKNRERAGILSKYGLTDSEYDWIGTQLSSAENREMAELVASKLKG